MFFTSASGADKAFAPCKYELVLGPDTLRAAPDVEHLVLGSVAQSESTQNHTCFAAGQQCAC